MNLLANRGDVQIGVLKYAGERFSGAVKEAKLVADKLNTVADLVKQQAKSVFQNVEGLIQTRAKRARSLFEQSYHLKGRNVHLKAEEDAKIDGKQIHLG
jgi:hypothetical protein